MMIEQQATRPATKIQHIAKLEPLETFEEVQAIYTRRLDHLESLLSMPRSIQDNLLEENLRNTFGSKTYRTWKTDPDYKLDQDSIFSSILRTGTYMGTSLACPLDKSGIWRNTDVVLFDGLIHFPVVRRRDKPYRTLREYTPEEIEEYSRESTPMIPDMLYTPEYNHQESPNDSNESIFQKILEDIIVP